jgi:hypothetical protein
VGAGLDHGHRATRRRRERQWGIGCSHFDPLEPIAAEISQTPGIFDSEVVGSSYAAS